MLERTGPYTLLLARVVVGIVFIAHGLQKLLTDGIGAVAASFDSLGIPAASLAAPLVVASEIIGGVAFIVGAGLPVFGVILALDMVGAIFFVHLDKGFFSRQGGYEYVLVLTAVCLAIGFSGGGALALDRLWRRDRALTTVRTAP
ncbi:DoxX family protein [Streptosporangium carneum]|uniref:Membrane protein n=1 Tax=Streptosporangium carneum TaxID=47481 RepID=A0A9W6HZ79_9ACTN|nr:DoxX family protein [Streptosporangium carneum]GLK09016.1 membrane protein [Streptosporangium carneum]